MRATRRKRIRGRRQQDRGGRQREDGVGSARSLEWPQGYRHSATPAKGFGFGLGLELGVRVGVRVRVRSME